MDHGSLSCHVQCYCSRMLIFCISVVCCMVQSSSAFQLCVAWSSRLLHFSCVLHGPVLFCTSVVCCMVQSSSVQLLQPTVLNSSAWDCMLQGFPYPAPVVQIHCSPQNVSLYRQHCHLVCVCVRPLTLLDSAVHIHCTQYAQILHILMARLQISM